MIKFKPPLAHLRPLWGSVSVSSALGLLKGRERQEFGDAMRHKVLIVCAAMALLPNAGVAYPIQGLGATSCATFAKMYQSDPENMEVTFFTWAQGYMSGLNMGSLAANGPSRELAGTYDDQKRALRAYCSQNPLKTYMDAVIALFGTLPLFKKSN